MSRKCHESLMVPAAENFNANCFVKSESCEKEKLLRQGDMDEARLLSSLIYNFDVDLNHVLRG